MSESAEQEVFDTEFTWMMECEQLLDNVIRDLGFAGVRVDPHQRTVVARWLDMFSDDSPIPLTCRMAMLRGMLASCPAP